jgi:porin
MWPGQIRRMPPLRTPAHKLRLAAALAVAWSTTSVAQSQPPLAPSPSDGTLLGNLGGVRPTLDQYGVALGLQTVDELFGNPNGGRAQGVALDGENTLSLGVDLEKAAGLKGGIFNLSAPQNYGHGPSASKIDSLNLVSSIEAIRSAWLFELWYQQSFFGGAGGENQTLSHSCRDGGPAIS